MAQLLNRARVILLDEDKRGEYDSILTTWEGPVSKDGTPVIRLEDSLRAEMAMKSPEEIESVFAEQREQVAGMVKHNPKHQALLGRMLEAAKTDEVEEADQLRDAYDDALFAEDQVLAIEEAERGRLLGLVGNKRYETAFGYTDKVQAAIEDARATQAEEYQRRALGGVGVRLALMAGESIPTEAVSGAIEPVAGDLPHYFDSQAKQVIDIATKREELLAKRLEIFQPTYPIAEVQTEAMSRFAVGITNEKDGDAFTWIGFDFDADTINLTNIEIPEEIKHLLTSGEYRQAYAGGFNIFTFAIKDQIEINTLLEEACNKHLRTYYPGLLDS